MRHFHKFRVGKNSTFGLTSVHALLSCVGEDKGNPCRERMVKILKYTECEQKVTRAGNVTYFYAPRLPMETK